MIKNHPKYDWSFARLFSTQTNPKSSFPTLQNTLLQELCLQLAPSTGHALDVGCAVGRMTFGLSQHFQSVTGIDLSMAFIEAKRGETKIEEMCQGYPLLRMLRMLGCSTLGMWFRVPAPCHEVFGNCKVHACSMRMSEVANMMRTDQLLGSIHIYLYSTTHIFVLYVYCPIDVDVAFKCQVCSTLQRRRAVPYALPGTSSFDETKAFRWHERTVGCAPKKGGIQWNSVNFGII